jgi:hypothetical protein
MALSAAQYRVRNVPRPNMSRAKPHSFETCPRVCVEDHPGHWMQTDTEVLTYCPGWYALTRQPVKTPAYFHAQYLRAVSSDIIHKGGGQGNLIWYPLNFHASSSHQVLQWEVRTRCRRLLQSPALLDSANPSSEIRLCSRC